MFSLREGGLAAGVLAGVAAGGGWCCVVAGSAGGAVMATSGGGSSVCAGWRTSGTTFRYSLLDPMGAGADAGDGAGIDRDGVTG